MSYYNMHHLNWNTPEPSEDTLVELLSTMMNLSVQHTASIVLQQDPAKWYDANQHIATLSREWPQTLFSLDCEGENGDRSITFFQDGLHLHKEYEAPIFNEQEFQERATPVPQT